MSPHLPSKARSRLAALLGAALHFISASAVQAEAIRCYYSVNQKVFLVSAFEGGLPKLDHEVEPASSPDLQSLTNFQWQIDGALKLEPGFAAPIVDYSIARIAPSYKERSDPQRCEVRLQLAKASDYGWKSSGGEEFLIVAWVADGQIKEAFVTSPKANARYASAGKFSVDRSRASGYPMCWYVRDGSLVARSKQAVWDPLFFGAAPDAIPKDAIEARDANENTVLHYAAANGREDLVELIAATSGKIVKQLNETRESAMSAAAKRGRASCVASLLAKKATVEDEESLLFDATDRGHIDVVRLLGAKPARSRALKSSYSWALSLAINENFEDLAIFLMDQGGSFSLSGKLTEEQLVLSKFANGYPDMGFRIMEIRKVKASMSERGFNLFHAVAPYADNALLDRLLAAGCDLTQRSDTGLMPMDVAVGLGNVEAICWFIDNGGRNMRGEGQVDPVFRAIEAGREDSVQCLINYGYDINREIAAGVTPIMFAVVKGEAEIARSILQAGGAWMIDSPYMELVIARIVRQDAADLLDAALEQGWELSRGISNALSLAEAAAFYEAGACQKLLANKGIDVSVVVPPASALSVKPLLLTPFEVEYPVELQRKYGERDVHYEIAISAAGEPTLLRFGEELEPEIADLLEQAIYKLRFEPGIREGEPSAVAMRMKTTLRVDMSSEMVFDMSEVTEKPKALQIAPAHYPFVLQQSRLSGEVLVEFIIRESGEVANVRVVRSTESGFDASAMASVVQSIWRPATLNGKPVACRVRLPIVFKP